MMHIQKNYRLLIVISLSLSFFITGCSEKEKKTAAKKTQIVIAKKQTPVQHLYFTGSLAPISHIAVVSPVAGNIGVMYFTYGERVHQGQKLFVIDSHQLAESYRKAVSDFLQKKQSYTTKKLSYSGTKALHGAGVISKNEYLNEKMQYDNDALNYLQSRYQLEKVLHTADINPKKIEQLSISDTDKVNAILQRHFRHIVIQSPGAGVALFPTKHSSNSNSSHRLSVGNSLKRGQLLLTIGDLSGLSAKFEVSEISIEQIHKGMNVIITGHAFPGVTLRGVVTAVSSQASQSSGGAGLSMFSVKIKIPKVTETKMKKIRVGMTAKFEISIKSSPHIMLPVQAVFQKNGKSMVIIVDKNDKQKMVPVVPGGTTATQVVIIQGINPGDRVIITEPRTKY